MSKEKLNHQGTLDLLKSLPPRAEFDRVASRMSFRSSSSSRRSSDCQLREHGSNARDTPTTAMITDRPKVTLCTANASDGFFAQMLPVIRQLGPKEQSSSSPSQRSPPPTITSPLPASSASPTYSPPPLSSNIMSSFRPSSTRPSSHSSSPTSPSPSPSIAISSAVPKSVPGCNIGRHGPPTPKLWVSSDISVFSGVDNFQDGGAQTFGIACRNSPTPTPMQAMNLLTSSGGASSTPPLQNIPQSGDQGQGVGALDKGKQKSSVSPVSVISVSSLMNSFGLDPTISASGSSITPSKGLSLTWPKSDQEKSGIATSRSSQVPSYFPPDSSSASPPTAKVTFTSLSLTKDDDVQFSDQGAESPQDNYLISHGWPDGVKYVRKPAAAKSLPTAPAPSPETNSNDRLEQSLLARSRELALNLTNACRSHDGVDPTADLGEQNGVQNPDMIPTNDEHVVRVAATLTRPTSTAFRDENPAVSTLDNLRRNGACSSSTPSVFNHPAPRPLSFDVQHPQTEPSTISEQSVPMRAPSPQRIVPMPLTRLASASGNQESAAEAPPCEIPNNSPLVLDEHPQSEVSPASASERSQENVELDSWTVPMRIPQKFQAKLDRKIFQQDLWRKRRETPRIASSFTPSDASTDSHCGSADLGSIDPTWGATSTENRLWGAISVSDRNRIQSGNSWDPNLIGKSPWISESLSSDEPPHGTEIYTVDHGVVKRRPVEDLVHVLQQTADRMRLYKNYESVLVLDIPDEERFTMRMLFTDWNVGDGMALQFLIADLQQHHRVAISTNPNPSLLRQSPATTRDLVVSFVGRLDDVMAAIGELLSTESHEGRPYQQNFKMHMAMVLVSSGAFLRRLATVNGKVSTLKIMAQGCLVPSPPVHIICGLPELWEANGWLHKTIAGTKESVLSVMTCSKSKLMAALKRVGQELLRYQQELLFTTMVYYVPHSYVPPAKKSIFTSSSPLPTTSSPIPNTNTDAQSSRHTSTPISFENFTARPLILTEDDPAYLQHSWNAFTPVAYVIRPWMEHYWCQTQDRLHIQFVLRDYHCSALIGTKGVVISKIRRDIGTSTITIGWRPLLDDDQRRVCDIGGLNNSELSKAFKRMLQEIDKTQAGTWILPFLIPERVCEAFRLAANPPATLSKLVSSASTASTPLTPKRQLVTSSMPAGLHHVNDKEKQQLTTVQKGAIRALELERDYDVSFTLKSVYLYEIQDRPQYVWWRERLEPQERESALRVVSRTPEGMAQMAILLSDLIYSVQNVQESERVATSRIS